MAFPSLGGPAHYRHRNAIVSRPSITSSCRAGRQGDPGSFAASYLSLQDDLLRIFGGDRMQN